MAAESVTRDDWVELGRLGAPQGLKGWMRIQSFTDPPDGLLEYPSWRIRSAGGAELRRLAEARLQGRGWLVRLEGVETREAAEALTGSTVEIERTQLPALGEREYYQSDLVGCRVTNVDGIELGVVSHFIEAPAHPVMAVVGTRERLIPATPGHLRRVDLNAKALLVDWPEDF